MTVLEVSPGPGVFQQHIWDKITPNGELVALDLSLGMLRQCRKKQGRLGTHLIQGNGAYLPFMDGSFDALFHFGGLNLFNEPEKALSEFVRVVRDGGIVSWGDEGFAPSVPEGWKKRLLTRVNPGFLKPIPTVPDGTTDVAEYEVYGGFAYLEVAIKG
jgi:ubiquinone/menaquinone biosynthesis C-methylase UbiE